MDAGCMLPPRHKAIVEAIRREGNPYNRPRADRQKPYLSVNPSADSEFLFFGGCTAAYLVPDTIVSALKILRAGGVSFTFLGSEEPCCGSVMFRSGYSKDAEGLALQNLRFFGERGFSKVVTVCSGCYRTFKVDYPELFGDTGLRVYHISEVISNLLDEGRLKVKTASAGRVTYHDPCHLGIHCGVFEQPREVIRRICGENFVEMIRNRKDSRCCGAGGGVKSALPEVSVAMGEQRILDAEDVGASRLLSACPFCLINLRDAAKQRRSHLEIDDLANVVAAHLV